MNKNLYKNYGKKSKEIEVLFNTIKNIDNIPYELLSKYYSKIYYDNHSKFYKKIKEKKNEYLAYTKVLYEGIKLKSLPVASNNVLYRVSLLSREFISKVENYIIKKNKDLPAAILFIRTFLTFTKNEIISNCFLNSKTKSNNLCKVLFILEKDNSIDYTLSTHVDFKNKALFFPFSCFEIKSIIKKDNSNDKYEIQLSYLGKYLNNLKNDEKIFENQIPDSDFPKEIIDFGLIEEDLKSINLKILLKKFEDYKVEYKKEYLNIKNIRSKINESYYKGIEVNFIVGEVYVNEDNKEIRIINSCNYNNKANKEEIEKTKITIDGKPLDKFSYFHKFNKKGKYTIKYKFNSNLQKACYLFSECETLISLDLSNLNYNSINDMSSMFLGCKLLKKIIFIGLKTKNVTDMSYLFSGCKSLEYLDLSDFNTEKVVNMNNMFSGCELLTNIDLSNINTEKVTDMSYLFAGCELLSNLDLSKIKTENVNDMSYMFYECKSLLNLDLSNFNDTKKLTDISSMFSGCESLTNINLSKLNTENVTDMSYMFFGCKSLTDINLSNFNTEKVIDMSWMFSGCESLQKINLSNFKAKDNNNISSMFAGCKKLNKVDLSELNTKDNTNMCCLFNGCKDLKDVNLSNFNTKKANNLFSIFHEAKSFIIECKNIEAKEAMNKE